MFFFDSKQDAVAMEEQPVSDDEGGGEGVREAAL